jgi:D-alanine-D-alanine ligase
MRVVVLCGGESTERDVSLASGWALATALAERDHEVSLIDPAAVDPVLAERVPKGDTRSYPIPTSPPAMNEQPVWRERMYAALTGGDILNRLRAADRVFMGLIGGWSEDGHVQALLEMAGIAFTGAGSTTCAITWHKERCQTLLGAYGVPVPERVRYEGGAVPLELERLLDAGPVVVKPVADGSSVDVRVVRSALELVAQGNGAELLVEPFLPGREFTVAVLGDLVLPVVEIGLTAEIFDYQAKYQPGAVEEICPADVPPDFAARLQELARTAHDVLGFGPTAYSRSDFRCDAAGNPYCLEINALPGLSPASLVPRAAAGHGWTYADLADRILHLRP